MSWLLNTASIIFLATTVTVANAELFYLEEVHCNANIVKTYIRVLDSDHQVKGQFSNILWTFNNDLVLHDVDKRQLLKTDIKSFAKLRSRIEIWQLDPSKHQLAYVEQDLLNAVSHGMVKGSGLGELTGNYRTYSVYDPDTDKWLGTSTKSENWLGQTMVELTDHMGTVHARAVKSAGAKAASLFCQNAVWTVSVYTEHRHSVLSDWRVMATIVAHKAFVDISEVAKTKWNIMATMLDSLLLASSASSSSGNDDDSDW